MGRSNGESRPFSFVLHLEPRSIGYWMEDDYFMLYLIFQESMHHLTIFLHNIYLINIITYRLVGTQSSLENSPPPKIP